MFGVNDLRLGLLRGCARARMRIWTGSQAFVRKAYKQGQAQALDLCSCIGRSRSCFDPICYPPALQPEPPKKSGFQALADGVSPKTQNPKTQNPQTPKPPKPQNPKTLNPKTLNLNPKPETLNPKSTCVGLQAQGLDQALPTGMLGKEGLRRV